jgi:hypothetical protein
MMPPLQGRTYCPELMVHRVSLLLSGVLVFVLCSLPPVAMSQTAVPRRCDHKGVSTGDVDKVRPVAKRTVAGHHLNWSTLVGCTHSAGAWVTVNIINEPQPDGSMIHGAAWCNRARLGPWSCEYASGRAYRMSVMIGGEARKLDTDIPNPFAVTAANRLMQQAVDIAPRLALEQLCGYGRATVPVPQYAARVLEEIHRDFRFDGEGPYARIVRESDGKVSVEVGVNYLLFEPVDANTFRFSCWDMAVTV